MPMSSRSIRWRLQAWLAFFLVLLLTGFGFSVYHLERTGRLNRFDSELESRVSTLSMAVRGGGAPRGRERERPPEPPPYPEDFDEPPPPRDPHFRGGPPRGPDERPGPVRIPAEVDALFSKGAPTEYYYYRIWQGDRAPVASAPSPEDVSLPVQVSRDTSLRFRTRGGYREAFHFTERGDCILVGRSLEGENAALRKFALLLSGAGLGVFFIGIAGGWWLTSRAIRPIEEISETARRISAGNLAERIPVTGENELGNLASVLNSTFSRLEEAFGRQRQFTADASHELRTPLTLMIAEAQSALSRDREPEEYREALAGCLDAAQQMRRLTDALLELARSDDGKSIETSTLDLAECAGLVVERLRPLAAEHGLSLVPTLSPVVIQGVPGRCELVITNLVANAIHYNKPGGTIRIHTDLRDGKALVTVEDTGVGISPEDLPHIFDRFYRADKARSRGQGHFGLGLAICQAVVQADQGTITAISTPGEGSTFTVAYPAGA